MTREPPTTLCVLVVHPDTEALSDLVRLLRDTGYCVTGSSDFGQASELLKKISPDLLITHVRLGAFNGLHLVLRRHAVEPTSASIVMDKAERMDSELAREAKRLNAPYVVEPTEPAQWLALIAKVLAAGGLPAEELRRWPRKSVSKGLAARIGGGLARVLDLSYGGLRFEIAAGSERNLPSEFNIEVPGSRLSVVSKLVWTLSAPTPRGVWCGAILLDADHASESTTAWRRVVDTAP